MFLYKLLCEIEVTPSVDYQKLENLLILQQPDMAEIKQMAQP